MSEELKITKERVLKVAGVSYAGETIMKILFPEVFKLERFDPGAIKVTRHKNHIEVFYGEYWLFNISEDGLRLYGGMNEANLPFPLNAKGGILVVE